MVKPGEAGILETQGMFLDKMSPFKKQGEGKLGDQVFRTEVGVDVRLIEAPSFGKSIFQNDRQSSGA
jgi:hypothetical protein